jgi:hypothetical protein
MADGSNHPGIYSIDHWIDIMVGSEHRPILASPTGNWEHCPPMLIETS